MGAPGSTDGKIGLITGSQDPNPLKPTINASLQKFAANDFRRLMDEAETLDEGIMEVYLRALEPDCFSHYKPRALPYRSTELHEMILKYHEITSKENRSSAWRDLLKKDPGYFKALADARYENFSNISFLTDMLIFFEDKKMSSPTEMVRFRLWDFPTGLKYYELKREEIKKHGGLI